MLSLTSPRHISTLRKADDWRRTLSGHIWMTPADQGCDALVGRLANLYWLSRSAAPNCEAACLFRCEALMGLIREAWMPDAKSPTASTGWEARAKRIGQALACGDMKRHKGAISLSFDEPGDRDLVWSLFDQLRKESRDWWRE
jgi:hypothetical protein